MTTQHTDSTGAAATVTERPGRFVVSVDGHDVGLADYADDGGRRVFPHTEVRPAYRGRGLATILVAEALRATREQGLRIVPQCSMVADFIDRHPEYADDTDWT